MEKSSLPEEIFLLDEIRAKLKREAEEDYRVFSSRLLPGTGGILGVRLPKIRRLAKSCAKKYDGKSEPSLFDVYEKACQGGYDLLFEERLFWGMAIGYAKLEREEREKRLYAFLPLIDNWSVCDSCCITYKFMKEEPEVWWDFLKPLFHSDEEFIVRFALVCGLDFFIEKDYIKEFLFLLEGVRCEAYYAQMAQAWALSMCYVSFPEQTEKILTDGGLSDMVQNKTIQKIRESLQVEKESKDRIVRYRRK